MNPMQTKAHAAVVTEVQAFMHRHGLAVSDLIDVGGAELKSSNPKTREKARRIEKCWALMARVSVNFADLERVSPERQKRHEGDVTRGCFYKLLKLLTFQEFRLHLSNPVKSMT